jgi:hypothetical protein
MPGEARTILSMFGGGGAAKRPATFDARGGRASAGATRRRAASGSSFGECPLCAKSFHPALLHAHVDECVGVPEGPPVAPAETKTETNAEANEAISNAEAETGAAETGRDDPEPRSSPPDAIATEPAPRGSTSPSPSRDDPSPGSDAPRPSSGAGAFAALMRAQRGATCKRVFSLWIADGEWRWCLERGVAPGEEARSRGMGPARWSCAVHLKEKTSDGQPCATTLTLVTDVAPASAAELSAVAAAARRGEAGETPRLSPGLIKSALQKSVRRGKSGAAGRAAALLLAENPAEALRRLVVVSVEDAALHPSTPLACWLMAANAKGYGLPAEARGAMVRYAAELAACAVKDEDVAEEAEDVAPSRDETTSGKTKPETNPETKTSSSDDVDAGSDPNANLATACAGLDSERGALVCSLLVRAHFGGMRGDVDMLRAAALTWRRRLSRDDGWLARLGDVFSDAAARAAEAAGAAPGTRPRLACAAPANVGAMTKRDVPPAAIDFHVSPIVEELARRDDVRAAAAEAARRAPGLDPDPETMLRSAMWTHSSSVTDKTPFRDALGTGTGAGTGTGKRTSPGTSREEAALSSFWDAVGDAAESFQRRFIARRFF